MLCGLMGTAAAADPAQPDGGNEGENVVLESKEYPADVDQSAWYFEAVAYVLDNGVMNGTGQGFSPAATVTRGMVYQTLYNLEGRPAVDEAATFTDVAGTWYADAAAWAEDEGLTTGTGKGLFSGERDMTRQELAKAFADYAQQQDILPEKEAGLSGYSDAADVADWALAGMQSAVTLGILKGSGGRLNPTGTAQRTELAQMLMNYSQLTPSDALKVAMVIPGAIDDGGFMQGGYEGLMMIRSQLGARVEYLADVEATDEALTAAIDQLAAGKPDLLMAHGGQCASAMQAASERYPDIQFVVLHGDVQGENLSSYGVVQEQATFLAGAAAGLLTQTNVVGHMSGLRVPAGVKARGAFADGLHLTNPEAKFLTNFSGDLNDQELAYNIALAEIEEGADIIFAMLNDAMPGVCRAVEEKGIHRGEGDSPGGRLQGPDHRRAGHLHDLGGEQCGAECLYGGVRLCQRHLYA